MQAEDNWMARAERQTEAFERAKRRLSAEFMQALSCPLVGSVETIKGRRYPVVECLFENLAFGKYRAQAAQAIAILMRDPVGREICELMADVHAEDYAEADE